MLEVMKTVMPLANLVGFAAYMITAIIILCAFAFMYTKITPHREIDLIRQGNTAAAIAYSGTVIGFALAFNSILSHSQGLVDFVVWSVIAGAVQLMAFLLCRITLKDLSARIERQEVAAGIFVGAVSVAFGLLNAACMVPA